MIFTDSHCHLTFPEFADQMPQVRAAMAAAQVDRALCICTTLEEFDDVQALVPAVRGQLLPHVLVVTDPQRTLTGVEEDLAWLVHRAAEYLQTRGEPALARPLFERAWDVRRSRLGEDYARGYRRAWDPQGLPPVALGRDHSTEIAS